MAININVLNSQLNSLNSNSNLDQVLDKKTQVVGQTSCQLETGLKDVGVAVSGIVPLSGGDHPLSQAVSAVDSIVEITGSVPGLEDKLIGNLSSARISEINSAIGETVANGELKLIISTGSPEAISRALKNVTSERVPDAILSSIAAPNGKQSVSTIEKTIESNIGSATGLSESIAAYKSNFSNILGFTGGSLLSNVTRKLDSTTDIVLDDLINGTGVDKEEVVNLIENDNREEATKLIASESSKEYADIEEKVNQILINPNDTVEFNESKAIGKKTGNSYVIGSNNNSWKGKNTPISSDLFTYVDSKEELVAEFRNSNREITEFIAHWTGSYTNQDIGSPEVHAWHLDNGWSGCGYHYVIRRDGRIQRGRPIDRKGAHSAAYGHNDKSIGVSMAGGYNCPTGTNNPNRYISADSLTPAQMDSFKKFVGAFYEVWPSGQALGHNDTSDKGKLDPGFDVPEYVSANFNKTNLITDAKSSGPLTTEQINSGIIV